MSKEERVASSQAVGQDNILLAYLSIYSTCLVLRNPPGRVRAYVHWHLHNKHKHSMYKLAPYLTHQSSLYQLQLFRIRTQHTIHIISSHLHHAFRNPRADYQDRVCPYCLASGTWILGDELHIICQCPTTKVVLDRFAVKSLNDSYGSHDYWTFPPSLPSQQKRPHD